MSLLGLTIADALYDLLSPQESLRLDPPDLQVLIQDNDAKGELLQGVHINDLVPVRVLSMW